MAEPETRVEAPSLFPRLKYYLLNLPPDERYRRWVEKDMLSIFWVPRSLIPMAIGYVIGVAIAAIFLPLNIGGFLLGSAIGIGAVALLQACVPSWRRWVQSRMMRHYEKRWARQRKSIADAPTDASSR